MIHRIYTYLSGFDIPQRVSGYILLARLIELSLDAPHVDFQKLLEKMAEETGLSTTKLEGRMHYALLVSSMHDEPAVQRFVRTAVVELRRGKEVADA